MNYDFLIKYQGRTFNVFVKGTNVTIEGFGPIDDNLYEGLRKYIEDEGFIAEADQKKGIFKLF
jgi:hypothetical protein